MSRLSRALAPSAVLAAAAIATPSALAADTTPPSLSVGVGSGAFGMAAIYNSGSSTSFGGNSSTFWSISGPNIVATSNEAGTIVFSWRDGITGQLKRRLTVPVAAGARTGMPVGDDARGSVIPFTVLGTGPALGTRHNLPAFSFQRFDAQAYDAAGNRSTLRSVTAFVGPDINLPVAY